MTYPNLVLHSSIAEISVKNLLHNFDYLQSKAGDQSLLLPMVKTNAYGHDIDIIQKALSQKPIAGLGVASITEALSLRENGFTKPILCLGRITQEILLQAYQKDITITLHSVEDLQLFKDANNKPLYHLEIETGMNRLGLNIEDIKQQTDLLKGIISKCQGVFSHFSESETKDDTFTKRQMDAFAQVATLIQKIAPHKILCHISNSGSVLQHTDYSLDWVRPGIALYGYDPVAPLQSNLKPVLSWKAPIVQIKTIKQGDRVGYGSSFVAKGDMRIATISVGYGDGFLRKYKEVGLGYQGKRRPILGNVCMDLLMIDITESSDPKVNDEVFILGDGSKGEACANEFAKVDQTICYEVLSRISRRVIRKQI